MKIPTIVSIFLMASLVSTTHGLLLKAALKKKLIALSLILASGGGASGLLPAPGIIAGGDAEAASDAEAGGVAANGDAAAVGGAAAAGDAGDHSSVGTNVPVAPDNVSFYYAIPVYYTAVRQVHRPVVYLRSVGTSGGVGAALVSLVSGSNRIPGNIQSGVKGTISNLLNPSTMSSDMYFMY